MPEENGPAEAKREAIERIRCAIHNARGVLSWAEIAHVMAEAPVEEIEIRRSRRVEINGVRLR